MYSKHRQKNAQISPAKCGRLLVFLSFLLLNGTLGRACGDTGEQELHRGRTVTAQWLSQGRTKRDAETATQEEHPIRGDIVLSSSDLQLVLQVERNHELLAPDFTETYYTEDGQAVTVTNHNYTDHCFYHGHVRGHPDSWVALSTCSGVRGLISLNSSDTYYLEPISGVDPAHHSLLSAKELPIEGGNCGHDHHSTQFNHISNLLRPFHSRVKRNIWGTTKYMELYIVADNTLFKRQNKDYEKTKARIMEIANYVDKFYRALNIRVPLIGLEVWTDRDQCIITEEPNATLWSFLQWRQKLKSRKKHDNAQLLTGVIFKGTTIGMAPLEGMCSLENSGGINVLKQAGTMCRGPAGACDLPEYCTGASPYCPANVYLLDGSSCQYGLAYCYNGMCLTHEQQCLQLWGYGARPAHDACFEDVNAAGNAFGNCGKDEHGNYMKCEKSDAKCGKIQCHSAAKKPKGTNAVSIDTTIKTGGIEVKCRGTYVYSTQDGQGDLPDPGLVMTGTKCGEGKVCRDRRCQNASFTELETCIARCHGNGVCNSNGNCHCNRGYAPPFCEKPGLGGSVDSGPIQYDSQVGLVVGLLFAFLVVLPTVLLLFYCYRVKTSYYHKWLSQREENKSNKTDAATDKGKNGHLNPAFHLKVVGPINKASGLKELPHTSKEVLPLRPGLVPNGTQPVNVVRPLRPAPSPQGGSQDLKVLRPPLPAGKPPAAPPKSPMTTKRLSPPKKPLPLNPARSPLLVSELQPRSSPFPPQRPLPLSPARGGSPAVSAARAPASKPSSGLLVMMPPAVGPKPVGKVSAIPPLRALRPVPGAKPNTASPLPRK
ncbi:disintegrin and metalloproteinase domain-containing protein 19 isoform X2 [Acanthochromis polyacanthus]|uniref:disintegrin and metalloproteinase domain-containing protein 19 isoform X2 n=1 Tax=Acanthochromis polyacanthus TaxID=80966 RepID=UPI0022346C32|nr:disintegrin and metalloproteinase domain-containing protein 19 isoform X2 [Acanthochromis polyacanthus]